MSFGYSVGDFIALGTLAWSVYKSCKGAPESFNDISFEVLSLHAVVKEAEETIFAQPLSPTKQKRLKAVGDGCYRVLADLDNLYQEYQSLGTQSKRTWDRMKWGSENIGELRARLISNTGLLTTWISVSQATVLKKLDDYLREIREGKREASVISAQTTDSLCIHDKQVWYTIRKQLEDIGITVAAFDANKDFISEWFLNTIRSGAFEERSWANSPAAEPWENLSDEVLRVAKSASRAQLAPRTLQPDAPVRQVAISSPGLAPLSNSAIGTIPPQQVAGSRRHIPRVAALIALVSRPNNSLITAAQTKNLSKVCEILNNQKKAVWLDKKSLDWALREVAGQGQEQIVKLLLEKGADMNATGEYGYTALVLASQKGDWGIVRLLLEKGADIDAAQRNKDTAVVAASRNGHKQIVQLLFEKGADIDAAGQDEDTALVAASRNGHMQIVQLLLEKGANINAAGRDGDIVLVAASRYGYQRIVRLLLKNGAYVNATGEYNDSPLEGASRNGHEHIVRLLLEKGADASREYGDTALAGASENGHEQIVRLLLQNGVKINAAAYDEDPALVVASRYGHKQIVQLLLENGANINAARRGWNTALIAASRNGNQQIVRLLLEKGAAINAAGEYGRTALNIASEQGHMQVVGLLREYGAQPY